MTFYDELLGNLDLTGDLAMLSDGRKVAAALVSRSRECDLPRLDVLVAGESTIRPWHCHVGDGDQATLDVTLRSDPEMEAWADAQCASGEIHRRLTRVRERVAEALATARFHPAGPLAVILARHLKADARVRP